MATTITSHKIENNLTARNCQSNDEPTNTAYTDIKDR
jgi:hypothetical protein